MPLGYNKLINWKSSLAPNFPPFKNAAERIELLFDMGGEFSGRAADWFNTLRGKIFQHLG